jgi:hypothetical protein
MFNEIGRVEGFSLSARVLDGHSLIGYENAFFWHLLDQVTSGMDLAETSGKITGGSIVRANFYVK